MLSLFSGKAKYVIRFIAIFVIEFFIVTNLNLDFAQAAEQRSAINSVRSASSMVGLDQVRSMEALAKQQQQKNLLEGLDIKKLNQQMQDMLKDKMMKELYDDIHDIQTFQQEIDAVVSTTKEAMGFLLETVTPKKDGSIVTTDHGHVTEIENEPKYDKYHRLSRRNVVFDYFDDHNPGSQMLHYKEDTTKKYILPDLVNGGYETVDGPKKTVEWFAGGKDFYNQQVALADGKRNQLEAYDGDGNVLSYDKIETDDFGNKKYIYWEDGAYDKKGNITGFKETTVDVYGNTQIKEWQGGVYDNKNNLVAYNETITDEYGRASTTQWRSTKGYDKYNNLLGYTKFEVDPMGKLTRTNWDGDYFFEGLYEKNDKLTRYKEVEIGDDGKEKVTNWQIGWHQGGLKPAYNRFGDTLEFHKRTTKEGEPTEIEHWGRLKDKDGYETKYQNGNITQYKTTNYKIDPLGNKYNEESIVYYAMYDEKDNLMSYNRHTELNRTIIENRVENDFRALKFRIDNIWDEFNKLDANKSIEAKLEYLVDKGIITQRDADVLTYIFQQSDKRLQDYLGYIDLALTDLASPTEYRIPVSMFPETVDLTELKNAGIIEDDTDSNYVAWKVTDKSEFDAICNANDIENANAIWQVYLGWDDETALDAVDFEDAVSMVDYVFKNMVEANFDSYDDVVRQLVSKLTKDKYTDQRADMIKALETIRGDLVNIINDNDRILDDINGDPTGITDMESCLWDKLLDYMKEGEAEVTSDKDYGFLLRAGRANLSKISNEFLRDEFNGYLSEYLDEKLMEYKYVMYKRAGLVVPRPLWEILSKEERIAYLAGAQVDAYENLPKEDYEAQTALLEEKGYLIDEAELEEKEVKVRTISDDIWYAAEYDDKNILRFNKQSTEAKSWTVTQDDQLDELISHSKIDSQRNAWPETGETDDYMISNQGLINDGLLPEDTKVVHGKAYQYREKVTKQYFDPENSENIISYNEKESLNKVLGYNFNERQTGLIVQTKETKGLPADGHQILNESEFTRTKMDYNDDGRLYSYTEEGIDADGNEYETEMQSIIYDFAGNQKEYYSKNISNGDVSQTHKYGMVYDALDRAISSVEEKVTNGVMQRTFISNVKYDAAERYKDFDQEVFSPTGETVNWEKRRNNVYDNNDLMMSYGASKFDGQNEYINVSWQARGVESEEKNGEIVPVLDANGDPEILNIQEFYPYNSDGKILGSLETGLNVATGNVYTEWSGPYTYHTQDEQPLRRNRKEKLTFTGRKEVGTDGDVKSHELKRVDTTYDFNVSEDDRGNIVKTEETTYDLKYDLSKGAKSGFNGYPKKSHVVTEIEYDEERNLRIYSHTLQQDYDEDENETIHTERQWFGTYDSDSMLATSDEIEEKKGAVPETVNYEGDAIKQLILALQNGADVFEPEDFVLLKDKDEFDSWIFMFLSKLDDVYTYTGADVDDYKENGEFSKTLFDQEKKQQALDIYNKLLDENTLQQELNDDILGFFFGKSDINITEINLNDKFSFDRRILLGDSDYAYSLKEDAERLDAAQVTQAELRDTYLTRNIKRTIKDDIEYAKFAYFTLDGQVKYASNGREVKYTETTLNPASQDKREERTRYGMVYNSEGRLESYVEDMHIVNTGDAEDQIDYWERSKVENKSWDDLGKIEDFVEIKTSKVADKESLLNMDKIVMAINNRQGTIIDLNRLNVNAIRISEQEAQDIGLEGLITLNIWAGNYLNGQKFSHENKEVHLGRNVVHHVYDKDQSEYMIRDMVAGSRAIDLSFDADNNGVIELADIDVLTSDGIEFDRVIDINKTITTNRYYSLYNAYNQEIGYSEIVTDSASPGLATLRSRSNSSYNKLGQLSSYTDLVHKIGFAWEDGEFLFLDSYDNTTRTASRYNRLGQIVEYFDVARSYGYNDYGQLVKEVVNTTLRDEIAYDKLGDTNSYRELSRSTAKPDLLSRQLTYEITYDLHGQQATYKREDTDQGTSVIQVINREELAGQAWLINVLNEAQIAALYQAESIDVSDILLTWFTTWLDENDPDNKQARLDAIDQGQSLLDTIAVYASLSSFVFGKLETLLDDKVNDGDITLTQKDELISALGHGETTLEDILDQIDEEQEWGDWLEQWLDTNESDEGIKEDVLDGVAGGTEVARTVFEKYDSLHQQYLYISSIQDQTEYSLSYKDKTVTLDTMTQTIRRKTIYNASGQTESFIEDITDTHGVVSSVERNATEYNSLGQVKGYLESRHKHASDKKFYSFMANEIVHGVNAELKEEPGVYKYFTTQSWSNLSADEKAKYQDLPSQVYGVTESLFDSDEIITAKEKEKGLTSRLQKILQEGGILVKAKIKDSDPAGYAYFTLVEWDKLTGEEQAGYETADTKVYPINKIPYL